jgi:hypothetical protein
MVTDVLGLRSPRGRTTLTGWRSSASHRSGAGIGLDPDHEPTRRARLAPRWVRVPYGRVAADELIREQETRNPRSACPSCATDGCSSAGLPHAI